MRRRILLKTALLAGSSVVFGSSRACEFWTTSLRIIHPWARATAEGQSTAAVCMKFDEVMRADRLIGAETPVASGAELGGAEGGSRIDFAIAVGQDSELSEGGVYLRLVDLCEPLLIGRTYPLTLTFEKSGPVKTDLTIDYNHFRFG